MKKVLINKDNCKECGICVDACPKGAMKISDVINLNGYRPVTIDDPICIGCGICYTMCPDWVFEIVGDKGE